MNIIIESLSSVRQTGSSHDFDSLKIFISKSITEAESMTFTLQNIDNNNLYPIEKIKVKSLEKNNYFGYSVSSEFWIPAGRYRLLSAPSVPQATFDIIVDDSTLIDEHEPILVIGRRINTVNTPIIAQDAGSQQLSFYIKKKYDGISFDDPSKKIMFDYIPVDKTLLEKDGKTLAFLSSRATKISGNVIPPAGQSGEWLLLKWDLPYSATKDAGIVQFAISVIDSAWDTRNYTWQTFPSSFTVSPNLGFREGAPEITEEEVSVVRELADRVNATESSIIAIEDKLGNQTDGDSSNDTDIVFDGGDISEYTS